MELQSFKKQAADYFSGVRAEWGKVSWPTRQQVIGETIIVLVVVFTFTVVVCAMDVVFKSLLGLIK